MQAGLRTRHITTVAITTACRNAIHSANLHARWYNRYTDILIWQIYWYNRYNDILIYSYSRNRSAPGANGFPYLVYKRCPIVMRLIHLHPQRERVRGIKQFRPISLLNVEGKVFFLHYGPETHPVCDDEPLRQYRSTERRQSRQTLVHLTLDNDLGGNSKSKKKKIGRVCTLFGWIWRTLNRAVPHQLIWMKTRNPPSDPDPTKLLRRFWDEVHHIGLQLKVGATPGWNCQGMRHLSRFRLFSTQRARAFQRTLEFVLFIKLCRGH